VPARLSFRLSPSRSDLLAWNRRSSPTMPATLGPKGRSDLRASCRTGTLPRGSPLTVITLPQRRLPARPPHIAIYPSTTFATIAALSEEQHFIAGPRQLRPSGFRFWVLLQRTSLVSFEYEVHLSQPALGSPPNSVPLRP
jgi:hypothetical protein